MPFVYTTWDGVKFFRLFDTSVFLNQFSISDCEPKIDTMNNKVY